MPIFEFSCNECGEKFEFFIHKLYNDIPKCPKCGSKNLEKLVSACNAHFKGKDFHTTDYDKNGRKE